MMERFRPVWAEVDLEAVRANVRALRALVAPAALCAVVKADGYGHGAVAVSRAALEAGADCLAVALVEEGVQLREAGIDAPILVLSEPVPAAAETVVRHRLDARRLHRRPVSTRSPRRSSRTAPRDPLAVHLKVDTGMHRVGCDRHDAVELAAHVVDRAELRLAGVCTHFAVADEPENEYTAGSSCRRSNDVLAAIRARGIDDRRRARVQHRRRDRGAGRALRHGARRHRHLRHRARAGTGGRRRARARRCR